MAPNLIAEPNTSQLSLPGPAIKRSTESLSLRNPQVADISNAKIAYEQLAARGVMTYRVASPGTWIITLDILSPFGLVDIILLDGCGDVVGLSSVGRGSQWQRRTDQPTFSFVRVTNRTTGIVDFVLARAIVPASEATVRDGHRADAAPVRPSEERSNQPDRSPANAIRTR